MKGHQYAAAALLRVLAGRGRRATTCGPASGPQLKGGPAANTVLYHLYRLWENGPTFWKTC